ncbi:hypothetical protein DIPPA_20376 [Diplonema papillatum]|nr:hypothetical protein DIPPA_20376 [Diplonema papillatum]
MRTDVISKDVAIVAEVGEAREHSLERDEGASFEVSELKAALALLQDEVAQAREGENEQVAVNQKLLEAVDSSEAALGRMKHHCEQLKGRVEEQDAALRKAEAAAAGHHRDIEHKNDVILRLEATVAEHEGEIRKLRDSYQSEIRRFDRDLAKLQVESDEKIDETNRMIDAYERNLHETEARLQAEALWRQRAEADIISLKKSADENGMTVFDAVEHHRRHGGFDHPLQETRQTQQDHEFMARSRVDLVQELWDLFGDLSKAVKAVQPVVQSHSFKLQARKATHDTDLPRVLAAAHARAQAARTKCRGIVANFFTDVEKLHCGASVASFQPDARVAAAYGYHGLQSPPADEAQPRVKPPQARVAFSPAKDGRSDSKTRSLTTPSGSAADTAGDREASARPELARRRGPRAPVQGPAGMASAGVHVSYAYAGVTVQTSTASSPPMRSAVDPYRGRSASLNLQHTSPGMAMSAKAVSPPRPLTPTRGVFVDELAARGQGAISPTTTNESRRLNAEIAELEYKLAGMMTVPTTRVQHPVITPRRYDSTPVSTRSGTASTQPASFRAHSASTTTTTTTTLTAQRAPSGTVSSAITQPTSDDFARPALAHR